MIFIPGNGGGKTTDNWFPWLQKELEKLEVNVISAEFPDPELSRKKYWLPFLKELGADENTILVGYSSRALAAMRYTEDSQVLGSILIGACHTDLGDEDEKKSGYYDNPWNWKAIKSNNQWIALFASTDDPYIPIDEPRFINKNLKPDYFEYNDRGHFMSFNNLKNFKFPEILKYIKEKV